MEPENKEEKLLHCSVCSRTFSFPETLANHELMHQSPAKQKTTHVRTKTKRANKIQPKHEVHPYMRHLPPEKVIPDKTSTVGQNVSHEVVVGEAVIPSPTWTYYVEPPKRDVTKDGVRHSSENISWPYNPEYFKKFADPANPTHSDAYVPSRVTWCYNEPSAKPFQQQVPVTSQCEDITWVTNKTDGPKRPINYQDTLQLSAETNQTPNVAVSASFSTTNQTLSSASLASFPPKISPTVQTPVPQTQMPCSKTFGSVQLESNMNAVDTARQETSAKPPIKPPEIVGISEDDKLYRCGLCWKTFMYLETFSNHMLGHRGRVFCLCNVCGKEFDFLPNLEAHVLSHKEKPYKCVSCDQRFRLWKCAKEHAIQHTSSDGGVLEDHISYL